jgi:hypothetical protein
LVWEFAGGLLGLRRKWAVQELSVRVLGLLLALEGFASAEELG